MVETIQQRQVMNPPLEVRSIIGYEWNISQVAMPNSVTLAQTSKPQQIPFVSLHKLMSIEKAFQDINKQMLETSYTLNLGQLFKIAFDIQKILMAKTEIFFIDINTIVVAIDNRMPIIQIQIAKNTIDNVLLVGGSNVNIILKQLKTKLGLLKPKPTPYNLKMVDQITTKPMGFIRDSWMYVHNIPSVNTQCPTKQCGKLLLFYVVKKTMHLRGAKVRHDWGNNMVLYRAMEQLKLQL